MKYERKARPLVIYLLAFITVLPLMSADKKGDTRFSAGPASSYPSKQTNDQVTIAAVPFDTEESAREAFGKLNPNQYGILPILVIIQNDTQQALRLSGIQVEYVSADRSRVENTPATDVKYTGPGPKRPQMTSGSPIPPGLIKHKNPLAAWEIEGRAFSAKMLPPHETASGFFYFQTRHTPGSKFYLTGINEAATGKEIYYFEIPLIK